MKLKKWGALLFALTLFFSSIAAAEGKTLVVGNTTRLAGNFFSGMWGNVQTDQDVQALLHGYDLVYWTGSTASYSQNPTVVEDISVLQNWKGDHVYKLTLKSGLQYSDGSPVTAWDYAFSILFSIAPQVVEVGGTPTRVDSIYGYEDYISGNAASLRGVEVKDDLHINITIRKKYLPFFYEMGLLSCTPLPISVIAPGCKVYDDGRGVYIANADDKANNSNFTAELLRKTLLDEETGYISHPSVVSGPYMLVSFDGTTAELEANPYFAGDPQGKKPTIEHLTYTLADNNTMIQDLKDGKFGLLTRVTYNESISQGLELARSGDGFVSGNYARNGLSYVSFMGERKTVQSQSVRQAIAYCMDKDALVSGYEGNYGIRVDGYYGIGQWMYTMAGSDLELETYTTDSRENDIAAAVKLLEEDGWVLNAEGGEYNGEGARAKMIGDELVVLDLTLQYPAGNRMGELMEDNFVAPLKKAGILLTLQPVEITTLFSQFYQQEDRSCDMIYMASNFPAVYDPALSFATEETVQGWRTWNNSGSTDATLYDLANKLRHTQPGSAEEYCKRWAAFQKQFSQVLPMIPVYSNVYFDFYTEDLVNYNMSTGMTWSPASLGATVASDAQ